ncbi:MAG: transcription termination factor Rho [Verrucomicrobiota bacterium]
MKSRQSRSRHKNRGRRHFNKNKGGGKRSDIFPPNEVEMDASLPLEVLCDYHEQANGNGRNGHGGSSRIEETPADDILRKRPEKPRRNQPDPKADVPASEPKADGAEPQAHAGEYAEGDEAAVATEAPAASAPPETVEEAEPKLEPPPPGPNLTLNELQEQKMPGLRKLAAEKYGIENKALKKHELICEILKRNALKNGSARVEGVLDIMPEGYGFLRSLPANYLPQPEDPYVSPAQISHFKLQKGDLLEGPVKAPHGRERYFALAKVVSIEGKDPEASKQKKPFDQLTPMFPKERLHLEGKKVAADMSMRVMDLVAPIGLGQRGLIVAAPRTGKTVLLQKIANAVMENNPNAHLLMLLIDERPEEVTDVRANVRGDIVSSTFDEPPERHLMVAEMTLERAKRLAEQGVDVVMLLDSVTRLTRAYNKLEPSHGPIGSGGVAPKALQKARKFFGAARNLEEGGSLTIVATALVDTFSKMDDIIFEEFKGAGNMEVHLDRALAERRIWPAINILKSGTRKEELLYHEEELPRIHALRKALTSLPAIEAMETLQERLSQTQNNVEFLLKMKVR